METNKIVQNIEQFKKRRLEMIKKNENQVTYRDENGKVRVSFDPKFYQSFLMQQEVKIATLPKIKHSDLIRHMLSKKNLGKITGARELHALEPEDDPDFEQEKVSIVSFARSGNTLSRAYIERLTGVITGSDASLRELLSRDLFDSGLWGEGLCQDQRVWCVKSHYPGATSDPDTYPVDRAVCCVRNPLDVVVSLFNFNITSSHDLQIHPSEFLKHIDIWSKFLKQEAEVWRDFNKYWLEAKIPVHIIRYEDIIIDPLNTFRGVMKFLFNTTSIEGRAAQKYLEFVVSEKAPEVYSVKSEKKQKCQHRDKFSQADLNFIYENCKDVIQKLGYEYIFTGEPEPADNLKYIEEANERNLVQSISAQESDELVQMTINLDDFSVRLPQIERPYSRDFGAFCGPIKGKVQVLKKGEKSTQKEEEEKQQ